MFYEVNFILNCIFVMMDVKVSLCGVVVLLVSTCMFVLVVDLQSVLHSLLSSVALHMRVLLLYCKVCLLCCLSLSLVLLMQSVFHLSLIHSCLLNSKNYYKYFIQKINSRFSVDCINYTSCLKVQ